MVGGGLEEMAGPGAVGRDANIAAEMELRGCGTAAEAVVLHQLRQSQTQTRTVPGWLENLDGVRAEPLECGLGDEVG